MFFFYFFYSLRIRKLCTYKLNKLFLFTKTIVCINNIIHNPINIQHTMILFILKVVHQDYQ